MARVQTKNRQTGVRLDSAEARDKLPLSTAREPYWVPITVGTALGYYKGERDRSWFVRQRVGSRYVKQRIGTPDDFTKADGEIVLTHRQAVSKALTLQLEERKPQPRHYRDGLTLNAVMEDYIEVHLDGKGSQAITRQQYGRHIRDGIGQKLVTGLSATALKNWLQDMAKKPPTVRGKVQPFDPDDPDQKRKRRNTANRVLSMVKAALNRAWKADEFPADLQPFWTKVDPLPLGEDPIPRMLDTDEIRRLLNAAAPDLRELLQGALMTGARRGELLSLRCRAFDPETGTLQIYQNKTGKTLTQPLTAEGAAFFDALTAGRDPSENIFLRADGRPWGMHDVQKPMAAAAAAANLEDVSFKTTRATYGKLLLVATKDLELVAKALGHSDSRVTRKHYVRVLKNEVKEGVDKLPTLGISVGNKVTRISNAKRGEVA